MSYDLQKHKITLRENNEQRRIFFKRQNIVRFSYPLAVMFGAFMLLSFVVAPAFASPYTPSVKLCTSYLSSFTHSSANADGIGQLYRAKDQRAAGSINIPVQLGFILGVRHALIPHTTLDTTLQDSRYSNQPNASKQRKLIGVSSHALAIAAYRACKKDVILKEQRPVQTSQR